MRPRWSSSPAARWQAVPTGCTSAADSSSKTAAGSTWTASSTHRLRAEAGASGDRRRRRADQVVEGAQRRLGALAQRDDDLLVGHGRHVAGREHARHRGLAPGIDDHLAMLGQLHRALEPVGVGQQADLHEHALERQSVHFAGSTVLVRQAVDLVAVAVDLGGLCLGDDLHIGQAVQLALQHRVGAQLAGEFEQRDVRHHAGQVDRGLDAGVAAADHRHTLALEQRPVAVRAVGHALGAVFLLTRHVHVAPARAGGDDHRAGLQRRAAGEAHFGQLARLAGDQRLGTLQVHDVHVVGLDVLFQRDGELRAVGLLDRDEVLDRQRVQHLAAQALGREAGADALARRVDGRGRAGRPAADDQHVVRCLGAELRGLALHGAGVELRDDLLQAHAALAEGLAVEEDRRHRHHLALLDLGLEQRAIDRHVADVRVQHRHQVERLHDVGAVLAAQRKEGLEEIVAFEAPDLFDHFGRRLRGVPANL
eukprot:Opistho-1_new@50476